MARTRSPTGDGFTARETKKGSATSTAGTANVHARRLTTSSGESDARNSLAHRAATVTAKTQYALWK